MPRLIIQRNTNPLRIYAVDKGFVNVGIRIDGLVHWRDVAKMAQKLALEANEAKKIELHLRQYPNDPERNFAHAREVNRG